MGCRSAAAVAAAILFLMLAVAAHRNISTTSTASQRRHPLADSLKIAILKGVDGDEASVAMRTDDLSIAAIINKTHHYHVFPGNEHLMAHRHTLLPFGNSYGDLIGGLANLPGVPLGRASMLHAISVLSGYDPATVAANDDELVAAKRAIAALTVMISEVQRLTPIEETVAKGWETEARVAVEHLPYIEHWDTMSFEIIRSHRSGGGAWKGPFTELLKNSANIRSKEEALAVVKVLVDRSFGDLLMAHATMIDI